MLYIGPLEKILTPNISAEDDVVHAVDDMAVSRASSLGLTPSASIIQESNSLMFQITSVDEIQRIRIE